ncbi:beta-lactamase superfamily II metal-dependent hydrolase [Clostridium algifaecis]|uniref:Beta-lactamase superfamily II metal-dependent hydrolase n=1 Tax=Clostridium algifaecis TaxID=1472040 RepID=A0ABS4KTV0_9CLOT|nr:MBL fold metallo-hydrolase [Clostridium algifaecis]MBP2032259.1 beta-lactamase superfamily II metal-dependent hydrolase [Clostridium algifaecis]
MKKKAILLITLLLVICMNTITFAKYRDTEVHFLDTGQSDCILIKTNNRNYLIDSGAAYYAPRIMNYLHLNKINKIDGIILTHYHDDHYEGIIKMARLMNVSKVYLPNNKNAMKAALSKQLSKSNTPVEYIDKDWSIKFGKMELHAIAPIHKDVKSKNSNSDENNNSIVLQGKIGNLTYLFPGDCEEREEEDMIKYNKLKKCNILKVPHHGLYTSTSQKFLNKVKPKLAIVTSNGIGSPNNSTIKRLLKNSIVVLRTDDQGNIIIKNTSVYCDKSNIKIKIE